MWKASVICVLAIGISQAHAESVLLSVVSGFGTVNLGPAAAAIVATNAKVAANTSTGLSPAQQLNLVSVLASPSFGFTTGLNSPGTPNQFAGNGTFNGLAGLANNLRIGAFRLNSTLFGTFGGVSLYTYGFVAPLTATSILGGPNEIVNGQLSLSFNGPISGSTPTTVSNANITGISLDLNGSPVPEPGFGLLVGGALVAVALMRTRLAKARA